jgi:hypothetical protein
MRTLGYFDGAHGTICIIEDKATGARRYYEGNAFQSHARRYMLDALEHVIEHFLDEDVFLVLLQRPQTSVARSCRISISSWATSTL